ncbi:MAG: DUF2934 domain-containing protein [Nitrospira sp.]
MRTHKAKEPRPRRKTEPVNSGESAGPEKEPVHSQPVSPCDDLQARVATRAYEIHAERGFRSGHALDDWLEAEREIISLECRA